MIYWFADLERAKERLSTAYLKSTRYRSTPCVIDIPETKPMHALSVRRYSSGYIEISANSADGRSYPLGFTGLLSTHVYRSQEANIIHCLFTNSGVLDDALRERTQMKVAIDRALHMLPGRQRMAFMLPHYGGYTFGEIEEIMGISTGAAKANHHHAVRKLRISLKEWL